ncbi:NADPH-dependent FMN reductase [Streptomyces umbrinus]|uniref:NADPH-dependent FMN reductase n=1 Tax=Streptomyces umbrinus TaxID=67370 RepID=UPI003C2C70E7
MKASVVVGNPRPRSRTLTIARAVADRVTAATGAELVRVIDLADHTAEIFDWPSEPMTALNDAIASSDLLVVASPTYKASYTGLLKAFFDRYPHNGLAGVTAVPVMTGSSALHGMAVEVNLRQLLVELGASVPTRGLFFNMCQMAELEKVVDNWAAENLTTTGPLGPRTRGAVQQ